MANDYEKQSNAKNENNIEKGDYLLQKRQFEEALEFSELVLSTDKYNPHALYVRACARYLKPITDNEKIYLNDKKILGITKDDLAKKDLSEAMSLDRKIYKKAKSNIEIRPLFISVFQYKSYKEIPFSEKAKNMFFDIYLNKVTPEDPLKALDEILHLYRDFGMALIRKGEIHYKLGNYDLAIRFFRKALFAVNFKEFEIWNNIARTQLKLRDIESVHKTLRYIEVNNEDELPGKYFLTRAALRSHEHDFYNARKDWKRALHFRSDSILLEEELLPLKRFEVITVLNKIKNKKEQAIE